MGANFIIPLIVLRILSLSMTVDSYGAVLYVQSCVLILCALVDFGYSISGVRDVAKVSTSELKVVKVVRRIQSARYFLCVTITLLILIVNLFTSHDSYWIYITLASLPALTGIYLQQTWLLQGLSQFKVLALSNLFGKTTYFIFVCSIVYFESADLYWISIAFGMSYLIAGALSSKLISRMVLKFEREKDLRLIAGYLCKDIPSFASVFILTGYSQLIVILTANLSGESAAGVLATADKVIKAALAGIGLVSSVVYPKICFENINCNNSSFSLREKTGFIFLCYTFIVFSSTIFFSEKIGYLLGQANSVHFSEIVSIMAFSLFGSTMGVFYGGLGLLTMHGDKFYILAFLAAISVCVTSYLTLISIYPGLVAALAYVISESFLGIFMWVFFLFYKRRFEYAG